MGRLGASFLTALNRIGMRNKFAGVGHWAWELFCRYVSPDEDKHNYGVLAACAVRMLSACMQNYVNRSEGVGALRLEPPGEVEAMTLKVYTYVAATQSIVCRSVVETPGSPPTKKSKKIESAGSKSAEDAAGKVDGQEDEEKKKEPPSVTEPKGSVVASQGRKRPASKAANQQDQVEDEDDDEDEDDEEDEEGDDDAAALKALDALEKQTKAGKTAGKNAAKKGKVAGKTSVKKLGKVKDDNSKKVKN